MNGELDRICAICGLTYGAHRADSVCFNQCPEHQGKMDWNMDFITTFIDSKEIGKVEYGTERKK